MSKGSKESVRFIDFLKMGNLKKCTKKKPIYNCISKCSYDLKYIDYIQRPYFEPTRNPRISLSSFWNPGKICSHTAAKREFCTHTILTLEIILMEWNGNPRISPRNARLPIWVTSFQRLAHDGKMFIDWIINYSSSSGIWHRILVFVGQLTLVVVFQLFT